MRWCIGCFDVFFLLYLIHLRAREDGHNLFFMALSVCVCVGAKKKDYGVLGSWGLGSGVCLRLYILVFWKGRGLDYALYFLLFFIFDQPFHRLANTATL